MTFVDPESIPATGNATIDAHHRHIARSVNRVYDAWKSWEGKAPFDTGLAGAFREIEVHLTAEEIITRGAGYQEWKFHETLHDALRARMRDVAAHAGQVEASQARLMQAFEFFDQVIFQHEFFEDQDFWDLFRTHAEVPRGPRLITWDSRLHLGDEPTDAHHERLVTRLNEVHRGIDEGLACEDVLSRFDTLIRDWLVHLESEAARATGRGLEQVRETSAILKADLAHARRHCEAGDNAATGSFLVNQARFWLLDHITYQHKLF